jgi:hypothetical protein
MSPDLRTLIDGAMCQDPQRFREPYWLRSRIWDGWQTAAPASTPEQELEPLVEYSR